MNVDARTYLAAHAPAQPQSWFKPVLPPQPVLPRQPVFVGNACDWDEATRAAYDKSLRLVAEHGEAIYHHSVLCEKLRATQWLWAWADAVLEQQGVAK